MVSPCRWEFCECDLTGRHNTSSDMVHARWVSVRTVQLGHECKDLIVCASECTHIQTWPQLVLSSDRFVGLVVQASASRAEDPGFESRVRRIFSESSHTSDFKIGAPVATLPGAWCYRVSTRTGWPGVRSLWLCEIESLVFNFYLSVAARQIVWADPTLRYSCMLLGRYASNQRTLPSMQSCKGQVADTTAGLVTHLTGRRGQHCFARGSRARALPS